VDVAVGAPLWPGEWTGVGTVLLALVTLGAILSTIFITRQDRDRADKRLADEQARHEAEVAEERRLADARLKAQRDQSEEQFRTEQWRLTEREQYTEAYAVQVTVGEFTTVPGSPNDYGDPGSDAACPTSCGATSAPFRTSEGIVTRSLHGTLGCGSKAATWACGTLRGRISWSVGWIDGEPIGNTNKVRSSRSLTASSGNPEGETNQDHKQGHGQRVLQP
jgi:hypothetical protein